MKQVLQNLSTGETAIVDVPVPQLRSRHVLVRSSCSLLSPGTERMLVEFGRAGWVDKARKQPDKLLQVFEKARTDGVLPTLDAVRGKIDQPLPLGYCNVGTVEAVGAGVSEFDVDDRVVSNGAHAELVLSPANLCARIPDTVSDIDASFVPLGAIALQGIRLAAPTLGECFVVTGLGIIGLLTVQLLRAQGCRVLALDTDGGKVELARAFGAESVMLAEGDDPVASAMSFSRGRGVDGVLLTLATNCSKPVSDAAKMCRKRGRVVLIGVAGLKLKRADFYEKELSFQVSCSYGPGRYDADYEGKGRDYPLGHVRWTAQRNFEAVLDMLASGAVHMDRLITHRVAFNRAEDAYELLSSGREPYLGIVLEYERNRDRTSTVALKAVAHKTAEPAQNPRISVIGAGNYAARVLAPNLVAAGASMRMIASLGGVSATHYGRKFGFEAATTDPSMLLKDEQTDAVVVATRHDSHAGYARSALEASKHVFVEKPLALTLAQLDEICETYNAIGSSILMVGFNRRFAPHTRKVRELLAQTPAPKSFIITVNAGAIPLDHWTQRSDEGGGRIVGEACHFIDLMRHLAGHPIRDFTATRMSPPSEAGRNDDKASITLTFTDGSFGTIHYLANGSRSFPKERVEVFCDGRILQIDNFRRLRAWGWKRFMRMNLWRQDKGQRACAGAFVAAVKKGGPAPIPSEELFEVSRIAIEVADALRK
jgi:predicted dehydrogenase/threonine dehydrogenase-like Zn-dependent dehydrogenase